MKKIGILAGMGPRSTSPFLEALLDVCQKNGAKNDVDYPHIMIYSLPTPFYMDREIDEDDLKKTIKEGLEKLALCDVDIIVIPCNTAHKYFDYITSTVSVPVLNMIDIASLSVIRGDKVAVLATEITMASEIYQERIKENSADFACHEKWQHAVNDIILGIKEKTDIGSLNQKLALLLGDLEKEKVNKVILACTDLNVLDFKSNKLKVVDASYELITALIIEARK